jgi:hypothetical protein
LAEEGLLEFNVPVIILATHVGFKDLVTPNVAIPEFCIANRDATPLILRLALTSHITHCHYFFTWVEFHHSNCCGCPALIFELCLGALRTTVYATIFTNKNCHEIRELGIVTANYFGAKIFLHV